MDAIIAVLFFAGLVGVNFLYEYILKRRWGTERFQAYKLSAKRSAEVGINQQWFKVLNAIVLTLFGMVVILLLPPRFAMLFGILTGLSIIMFPGFLIGGIAVAVILGWYLV